MLRKFSPRTHNSCIQFLCIGVLALPLAAPGVSAQSAAQPNEIIGEEPEFVLIGTSHIGDYYSATLRLSSGQQLSISSDNAGAIPLAGFNGYTVTKIEPKRVSIRHPSNAACAASSEQGVVCDTENVTVLELKVRVFDGVAAADVGQTVIPAVTDLSAISSEAGSFIDRIQTQAAATGTRAEVPDGMELIETSAGFQLIPDD